MERGGARAAEARSERRGDETVGGEFFGLEEVMDEVWAPAR
jgi:hypothetical protein